MARSNHHYYNICPWQDEIGDDGYCNFHRPDGNWRTDGQKCLFTRAYATRRGTYRRKERFPLWTWKYHSRTPPRQIKRLWSRRIRRMYDRQMCRRPFDPVLFDGDKKLAGWYGWWS